ncbi:CoxI translation protein CYA5 [Phlyctema vagabunda]|uniref:CoxI translation protein CYA5 n=1 Tax=Phlyctema vagabunda TaxID=108571 RepID=A0ABR4P4U3_9HELO
MLERTAGCLESGSLRRLLPLSQKALKSQRNLHSGFWNHGGGDIELSPLWETLMRGSEGAGPNEIQHGSAPGHTGLLEFLYPTGTFNLIRQHMSSGVDRQDGRRPAVVFGKLSHRQYTSSTKDPDGPVTQQLVDTKALPGSGAESESFGSAEWLAWFEGSNQPSTEEAWIRYAGLRIPDRTLEVRSRLLRLLSDSPRVMDAERAIEIFEGVPSESREAIMQGSAIKAHLHLRNYPKAIELHEDALARFKDIRNLTELSAPFSKLMAYLFQHSMWSQAIEMWKGCKRENIDYKIWHHTTELQNFPQLVADMVRHVDNLLPLDETPHGSNTPDQAASSKAQHVVTSEFEDASDAPNLRDISLRSGLSEHHKEASIAEPPVARVETAEFDDQPLKEFAGEAMRKAIIGNYEFDQEVFSMLASHIFRWNLASPEFYDDLIDHLYRREQGVAAIKVYRTVRGLDNARISRPVLDSMMSIFCDYHSVQGMQQVLDDWFRWYEGPSRRTYWLCLTEFARQGDVTTVYNLHEQYTNTHEFHERTANHFLPLLHVHAVRGEVQKVKDIFDDIQNKHGLQPTIVCYNVLMNAHAQVKDIDGAYACLETILADDDLTPDAYTFGTMMGICATRGDRESVQELFRLAEEEGVKQTTAMVNCLVLAYIYDAEIETAEKLCDKAMLMKLEGSYSRMWNYILIAHAMRRDMANVNRVVEKMSALQIPLNGHTYSALMQALIMTREPDRAWVLLKDVMPAAGILPTPFHYAVVMGGYLAVGNTFMVFNVHRIMTEAKMEDTASTRLLLLKNAVIWEGRNSQHADDGEPYAKAKALFRSTMKMLSPQDWAGSESKGKGAMPTDIAYPAAFYAYMMFMLAKAGDVNSVHTMYDEFTAFLPGNRVKDRPVLIWTAVMTAQLHEFDYNGVQSSWEAALAMAESEGAPLNLGSSGSQSDQILYAHQLDLTRALKIYMAALGRQRRVDDLIRTVTRLHDRGFVLDNKCWNHYIQALARGFRYKMAFKECETRLMPNWTGWNILRWRRLERNRLPIEIRRARRLPRQLHPHYRTLLYLAKAYIELRGAVAGSGLHALLLADIEREFPKVVHAIKTMQRTDEPLEREILRR